jgi:predicted MFS family arabinose efflux permease
MWYKRAEAQKRYSFFFSSTTLAGAFGGLLASAIGKMDRLGGYRGWRWIFILEGVLTCVVAIIFWFLLPDFPEDAKWLKEDERAYVKARLEVDQGKSALERPITFRDVVNVFKDYKIIVGGLMYFGLIVPVCSSLVKLRIMLTCQFQAYGYAYFAPSIIRNYGYSPIKTQLYSVPPWAAAFGFSMLVAWASDRLRHRFLFTLIPIAISIAGFAMLLTGTRDLKLRYAALFLVTCGCYSAMPVIVCWFTMNLGGHHRRSVGSAWQIGFGNIGGIIATFSFLQTDAPLYKPGIAICIGFICLSAASCVGYFFSVWGQNKHRAKSVDVGITAYEQIELGDLATTYRYQL